MPTNRLESAELEDLRHRLAEAEETLRAIRHGEVDALLITDASGDRVFTLRGADAPYRALVEQMQEGAVTLNAKGDIIYCNQRFAELVETPLQHVIGASIDQFIDEGDRPALMVIIGSGAGTLRTRLRHRTGLPLDAHMSISQVTVDDLVYRTLIVTDLSTITKVQRESRSKDEFLAMLAHELRNPLGAIGAAVQVLGLVNLREPRAVRARDVIGRQTLHMARLVDDLLDVGRVMTGKIVLERRALDLAECVRACLGALGPSEGVEQRIEVTTESVWVQADAVRMDQIVGNLVTNALKFTPADRPVRVIVQAEGAEAVLCVEDEGVGIDGDLLPHVFDLFVQADDTFDRLKGGLGIGLTLVRRLVELHGGTVKASSGGRGLGTTFTVRFPAMASPQLVSALTAPSREERPCKRVLLVDDHADSREMYSVVLRAAGHDVYEAEDGADAVEMFDSTRPDVAIVDIGLPTMNGYELAQWIRSQPDGADVTLIALTGYGFPEDRERSRAAGFDRHMVKPASPADLQREVDACAQRVRRQ